MQPLITIVIPAYNAEKFIAETLACAISQTWPAKEIIVVDDGSTDATAQIADSFRAHAPFLSVIRQKNAGVAAARNAGISASRGKYVAFLDADDLWHPDKLMLQMKALEPNGQEKYKAAFCVHVPINIDGLVTGGARIWPFESFSLETMMALRPVGNGSSLIVSRDVALEVGGFDPSYAQRGIGGCEDHDFELRVAAKYPIACVNKPYVGYRKYSGNMSSNSARMAKSIHETLDSHISINSNISKRAIFVSRYRAYEYSISINMKSNFILFLNHFCSMARMRPLGAVYFLFCQILLRFRRIFYNFEFGSKELVHFSHIKENDIKLNRDRDLENIYINLSANSIS